LPLHSIPLLWVHAVRGGSGGWDGMPLVQISSVQTLPSSAGVSLSRIAGITPPTPSQTLRLQSPLVCGAVTGVFAAVKSRPQTLLTQVLRWQSVSTPPGQVLALVQATPVPPPPPVPPVPAPPPV